MLGSAQSVEHRRREMAKMIPTVEGTEKWKRKEERINKKDKDMQGLDWQEKENANKWITCQTKRLLQPMDSFTPCLIASCCKLTSSPKNKPKAYAIQHSKMDLVCLGKSLFVSVPCPG